MSIQQILTEGGGALIIILTLLQIAPIKIDPWSQIAKAVGRAINGEVIVMVGQLKNDLQSLQNACDEREAIACRIRILRFGEEIMRNIRHTKEHFNQILTDIKYYEDYCEAHPGFRNNIAAATIEMIKSVYQKCLRENSFL